MDITAADMLAALDQDLVNAGMALFFAEMRDPTKDHLKRYDLYDKIGHEHFFPTINQAVATYMEINRDECLVGELNQEPAL